MCFVLGLIRGNLTNSIQLLLFSKTVQCIFSFSVIIGNTSVSFPINVIRGIASLIDCDKAIYFAFVVLKDISDCNFECKMIGYPPKEIKYPVLENTEDDSSLQL